MATTYSGDEGNNPTSITIPSDGDDNVAASVNAAFEGLMDKVQHALTGETEFGGAKTFLALVEFAAGLLLTGAITGSTVPGAGGVDRVLIADLPLHGGTVRLRFYTRASGGTAYPSTGLDVTVNARWDTGSEDWRRDATGNAYLYELFGVSTGWSNLSNLDADPSTITIRTKISAPSAWDYDSWDTPILALNPSNPTATSSAIVANTLYAKSIKKAWGKITTSGGGAVTLNAGFGMATVAIDSGNILCTLRNAMSSAEYAVVASPGSSNGLVNASIVSSTQFRIDFRDFAGNSLDPATTVLRAHFTVDGEQS